MAEQTTDRRIQDMDDRIAEHQAALERLQATIYSLEDRIKSIESSLYHPQVFPAHDVPLGPIQYRKPVHRDLGRIRQRFSDDG